MSELKASKYQAYPEYKDSGVEWVGDIPTEWEMWKLCHAYRDIGSGTTPPTTSDEWFGGTIPWVTTGELRESVINGTKKNVSVKTIKTFSALRIYPAGSIAMAMYGATIGRLGIFGVDATTNQACCVMTGSEVINNKYLFYWLWAFRKDIINLSSGGGQPNINQEKVASLQISAPKTDEQAQISNFLDHETAKIDMLIDKQQQLIKLLKEKRQAVISHAVTKGLNPQAPMKDSGVEWLGEVPAHWKVKKLKHFGRVIGGFAFKSGDFIQQGYPVIKITNVSHLKMSFNEQAYLPEKFAHENAEYIAPPNSLIFAMTRPIIAGGIKVAKMPELEEMPLINQRVGFLRIDDEELTDYILFSSISNSFVAQFENNMTITNQPNISSEGIELVSFPVPPEEELRQIKAYLTNNEKKFTTLVQKGEEQVNLLIERRTALISAAVTGKIDVRNWFKPTEKHEGR